MVQRQSLQALLINKKKGISFISQKPLFELVFQTRNGIISFEVNEEQYYSTSIGNRGILCFSSKQVISFGKWIKETSFNPIARKDLYWLNM